VFLIRISSYEHVHVSHIPGDWFDKNITITGVITDDPDRGLEKTKFNLGDLNILATSKLRTDVSYGDEVSVTGMIKHPENFMTDTDREFDYINYLAAHDIYGLMTVSHIEIINHHQKSIFIEELFKIKNILYQRLKIYFPGPRRDFLRALLLVRNLCYQKKR
jgi:hypothetical protein